MKALCMLLMAYFLYANPIIFNTQEFPPFNYSKNNSVTGPATEIIKAVCDKLVISCTFQSLPWRRAQHQVRLGQADGLYVVGRNDARERWLYFSEPILQTEYGFFTHKTHVSLAHIGEVGGMVVGVYGPSNTSTSLFLLQERIPFEIDMVAKNTTSFKKLNIKRLDYVYSNRFVGESVMRELGLENIRYTLKHKPLKYYVAFSKEHVSKGFVRVFNKTFLALKKEGKIKAILKKYQMQHAFLP